MDLVDFLQREVRQCAFDFDRVAAKVNESIKDGKIASVGRESNYTALECRNMFASAYNSNSKVDKPPSVPTSSIIREKKELEPLPPPSATSAPGMTTFSQVAAYQKSLEEASARRREDVFARVFESLGGGKGNSPDDVVVLSQEIRDIMEAKKREKAEKELKEMELKREKEEQAYLKAQREQLQHRFDPQSEDTQGIDPFAHRDLDSGKDDPSDYVAEEIAAALGNFEIENLLAHPEFDKLLGDLENELDRSAAGKDESTEVSELGEVLSFLNMQSEITEKNRKASTVLKESVAYTPKKEDEDDDVRSHSSIRATAAQEKADALAKANSERLKKAAQKKDIDDALTRAMGIYKDDKDGMKAKSREERSTKSSGRGGSGRPHGLDSRRGIGRLASTAGNDNDSDDGSAPKSSGSDDSDSDEDTWNRERELRKQQAAPSHVVPEKGAGFWGAFGESTTETAAGIAQRKALQRADPFYVPPSVIDALSNEGWEEEEEDEEDEEEFAEEIELEGDGDGDEDIVAISIPIEEADSSDEEQKEEEEEEEEIANHSELAGRLALGRPAVMSKKEEEISSPAAPIDAVDVEVLSGGLLTSGARRKDSNQRKKQMMQAKMISAKEKQRIHLSETISATAGAGAGATDDEPTIPPIPEAFQDQVSPVAEQDGEEKEEKELPTGPKYILESPCPDLYPKDLTKVGSSVIRLVVNMSSMNPSSTQGLCALLEHFSKIDPHVIGVHICHGSSGPELIMVVTGGYMHYEMKVQEALDASFSEICDVDTAFLVEDKGMPISTICTMAIVPSESLSAETYYIKTSVEEHEEFIEKEKYNLASCLLKPYVLTDLNILCTFLRMCEGNGLRLCAMRCSYMSRSVDYGMYLHQNVKKAVQAEKDPEIGFLALAFYSLVDSIPGQNVVSSPSAEDSAAGRLRSTLGPDDPALARRTDPRSARAVLGTSRDLNLAMPVSVFVDHVLHDFLFLFALRSSSSCLTTSSSGSGGAIFIPTIQSLVYGFSFEVSLQTTTSSVDDLCVEVAEAHASCLKFVSQLNLKELVSIPSKAYKALFPEATALARDGMVMQHVVAHCHTCAGALYIEAQAAQLGRLMKPSAYCSVTIHTKCVSSIGEIVENDRGVQFTDAHLFDDGCVLTHEYMGLQDTVVLQGHLPSIIDVITHISSVAVTHIVGASQAPAPNNDTSIVIIRGHVYSAIDAALAIASESANLASTKCTTLRTWVKPKVLKCRKALHAILQGFPTNRLFIDLARKEMEMYVPTYTHVVPAAASVAEIQPLFPPGTIDCASVVMCPWDSLAKQGGQGVLARILKRLEKEDIELISSQNVLCNTELLSHLEGDWSPSKIFDIQSLNGKQLLVLLVKGNCVIRRLKHIIGPFGADPDVDSRALNAFKERIPFMCPLNVERTDLIIHLCFKYQASNWVQIPSHVQSLSTTANHNSVFLELLRSQCHARTASAGEVNKEKVIFYDEDAQGVKIADITTVALSSAMLRDTALSNIIEQLSREGMQVVGMRSLWLGVKDATELLTLAGQSSLSIKCSLENLTDGPVLMLALEGRPYNIMKLKSLTYAPQTVMSAFAEIKPSLGRGGSIWKMENGENGIVASSSAKLALVMLLQYFEEVYGNCSIIPKV